MTEDEKNGKEEKSEPEFDATNPETHHQSQLMEFIMSDKAATVQSLLGGDQDKPEFVRHHTHDITYDIFRLKGIEAKFDIDSYEKMIERMEKMEVAETEDGKKRFTKKDVQKFIRATCYNKCKATRDELATRDDFVKMAEFVEDLLFNGETSLRENPPNGITQSQVISKYYVWEAHKFIVKVSVESYVKLEINVRKLKKKAKKEAALNIVAETKKVVFLQKAMRIKPGEYCSGAEYAAYYKEIFKAMYPKEFGSEKGLKKEADGIKPKDKEQNELVDLVDEGHENRRPAKKKGPGRPKGSKNKEKSD